MGEVEREVVIPELIVGDEHVALDLREQAEIERSRTRMVEVVANALKFVAFWAAIAASCQAVCS